MINASYNFDSLIVLCVIYFSYLILNPYTGISKISPLLIPSIALLASHHLYAFIYKLYKEVLEYTSVNKLIVTVKVTTLTIVTTAIIQLILFGEIYTRTLTITWIFHILLLGGLRFSWRMFLSRVMMRNDPADKKYT